MAASNGVVQPFRIRFRESARMQWLMYIANTGATALQQFLRRRVSYFSSLQCADYFQCSMLDPPQTDTSISDLLQWMKDGIRITLPIMTVSVMKNSLAFLLGIDLVSKQKRQQQFFSIEILYQPQYNLPVAVAMPPLALLEEDIQLLCLSNNAELVVDVIFHDFVAFSNPADEKEYQEIAADRKQYTALIQQYARNRQQNTENTQQITNNTQINGVVSQQQQQASSTNTNQTAANPSRQSVTFNLAQSPRNSNDRMIVEQIPVAESGSSIDLSFSSASSPALTQRALLSTTTQSTLGTSMNPLSILSAPLPNTIPNPFRPPPQPQQVNRAVQPNNATSNPSTINNTSKSKGRVRPPSKQSNSNSPAPLITPQAPATRVSPINDSMREVNDQFKRFTEQVRSNNQTSATIIARQVGLSLPGSVARVNANANASRVQDQRIDNSQQLLQPSNSLAPLSQPRVATAQVQALTQQQRQTQQPQQRIEPESTNARGSADSGQGFLSLERGVWRGVCFSDGCNRGPATNGPCPACLRYGGRQVYFCSNECFERNWTQHHQSFHPQYTGLEDDASII